MNSVDANTLHTLIKNNIDLSATVITDEWVSYKGIPQKHNVVNHGRKEYVRGEDYLSNIENFWAHFKRGINGIYHHVSPKHTKAYANEFAFRYNTRKKTENDRFIHCLGKINRYISYQQLISIKEDFKEVA